MRRCWEFGSDRIILECYRCGEKTILLGREEDWHMEVNSFFECQCGQILTIDAEPG